MLRRYVLRPGPWLVAGFLVGALLLHHWVESIGGPDALVGQCGLLAPVAMVGIQAALSAAPFPSELFALVSAGTYGWLAGSLMTWAGWTAGSMIQYALARGGSPDVSLDDKVKRLPAWFRRFDVTHPVFLVCVRWFPMGFHLANLAAGVRRVPAVRQLWIAALGSIPGAVIWAGIGAGVSLL